MFLFIWLKEIIKNYKKPAVHKHSNIYYLLWPSFDRAIVFCCHNSFYRYAAVIVSIYLIIPRNIYWPTLILRFCFHGATGRYKKKLHSEKGKISNKINFFLPLCVAEKLVSWAKNCATAITFTVNFLSGLSLVFSKCNLQVLTFCGSDPSLLGFLGMLMPAIWIKHKHKSHLLKGWCLRMFSFQAYSALLS